MSCPVTRNAVIVRGRGSADVGHRDRLTDHIVGAGVEEQQASATQLVVLADLHVDGGERPATVVQNGNIELERGVERC